MGFVRRVPVTPVISLMLAVDLGLSGFFVANHVGGHGSESVDTLSAAFAPASVTNTVPPPKPAAVHRHAVALPTLPPVQVPPIPRPTITVPPLPPLPSVPPLPTPPICPDLAGASKPRAAASWTQSAPGMDANGGQLSGSTYWYSLTTRDGKFNTHLVGVNVQSGARRTTAVDPYFVLNTVRDNLAWGTDHDGVATFDLSSGAVGRRWTAADFPYSTNSGNVDLSPLYVTANGTHAYVVGVGTTNGATTFAVSSIDISSGARQWTVPLMTATKVMGWASGPLVIAATSSNVYVALNDQDTANGVHVYRVDTAGTLHATRTLNIPLLGDTNPQVVAGPDGIYVTLHDKSSEFNGRIFRLSPTDLSPLANVGAKTLEWISAGPTGLWAETIRCNAFVEVRYDPQTLREVGRYELPNASYLVDATTSELWVLVTRSPMEPVRVSGYPVS